MILSKSMILSAIALLLAVSVVTIPLSGIALAADSEPPLDDTEDVSQTTRPEPGPGLQPLGDPSGGPPPDD